MSEITEVKELINEKLTIQDNYHKEVDAIKELGHKNSDGLVAMDTRLDEILDNQNKLEKAAKAKTELKEFKNGLTEFGMKEISDFFYDLRALGKGEKTHIDTNDMKSNLDFTKMFEANNSIQTKAQHGERNDSTGGIFIPPTIDSMIGLLQREYSNPRMFAGTATIGGDQWVRNLQNQTNGAMRRKDLADFSSTTKKDTFGQVKIMVADLFSIVDFTDNLEMDSVFNIVNEILSKAAEDFSITEALEMISGEGGGEEMKGILTYADGTGFQNVERITTGTTLKIDFDDVFNLDAAMKTAHQRNSAFFGHRLTIRVLRKLKDTQGRYLWEFSQQAGNPQTIAGKPIIEMPELVAPDATDSYVIGDEPLLHADLKKGYKIVDRLGITTLRDNLTQYPDIVYKLKKRSGGGVVLGEAIKSMKIK